MSYVRSSELGEDYLTRDGEALPAYVADAPALSSDHLSLANAAVLAVHQEENNPDGPTAAEVIRSVFESIRTTSDDAVAHILANFPNLVNPNSRNQDGKTALAAAVETGNIRMVEMLINMGADVDLWSVQGESTLHKYYYTKPWFRKLKGLEGQRNRRRTGNPGQGRDEYPRNLQPAYQILRTPLMIAAEKGFLPLVKLLFNPPCNADHTLCAPDGQIALRLAVENSHGEVVDFLPSLRKGGFRRLQYAHATSTYRIKQTTEVARFIALCLVWHIPKAVLYRLPKWFAKSLWEIVMYVLKKIPKAAKATWRGVVKCGRYVKNELPGVMSRKTKEAGRAIKKFVTVIIPRAAESTGKFLWKLITELIPNAITSTGKFIWKLISVHIPTAFKWVALLIRDLVKFIFWFLHELIMKAFPYFCRAVAEGLKNFATASWRLFVRGLSATASFFHTVFESIISFFRRVTLKDVWNAFLQVLKWIFVEVPTGIGRAILAIYKGVVEIVEKAFGWWGKLMVALWKLLVYVIIYFPMKAGSVLAEYFKVLVKGGKEVMVWFNPKR